jgi:predicted HTH domain antitoxin
MTLNITIDLPAELEKKLVRDTTDLSADVKEAYAVELFRRGLLDHYELSRVLGIDRFETDACLKRHEVFNGSLTMKDLEDDYRTLQRLFNLK